MDFKILTGSDDLHLKVVKITQEEDFSHSSPDIEEIQSVETPIKKGILRTLVYKNDYIIVGARDGKIYFFDFKTYDYLFCLRHTNTASSQVWGLAITDDMLISGGWDKSIIIWDLRLIQNKEKELIEIHKHYNHHQLEDSLRETIILKKVVTSHKIYCIDVCKTKKWFLCASEHSGVYIYRFNDVSTSSSGRRGSIPTERETGNPRVLKQLNYDDISTNCVHVFDNDKKCVVSYDDKNLRIWSLETFQILHVLQGHEHYAWSCKSYRNDYIISSSYDKNLILWDYKNEKALLSFKGHESTVNDFDVYEDRAHPHFDVLFSVSDDCTIRLWNIQTAKCISQKNLHADDIYAVVLLNRYEQNHVFPYEFTRSHYTDLLFVHYG